MAVVKYGACRGEEIFLLDAFGDLRQGNVEKVEFVLLDFHGDFLVAAAKKLHVGNAASALHAFQEYIVGQTVDIGQGLIGDDGDFHDRRRVDVALHDHRLVNACRKAIQRGIDIFRGVDGGGVGIGPKLKF